MIKNRIFIFLIFLISNVCAQPGKQVFNDTILHTLFIQTDLPNWFDTLERDFKNNFKDPDTYPEIYRKCTVTWDGQTITGCGFREKGNSSNSLNPFGKKKPFKISFDEYDSYQLEGLRKLNLNNFTNDPSLMHDALSFKLMRQAGLVAPRTSYTQLWINGEYIGLYLAVENVDKNFLRFHYGSANDNGNLYKTDRGASVFLDWLGPNSSAYKDKGLKLNTNESKDDWTKLLAFLDLINNYHGLDFKEKFEKAFDIHNYLKVLAIEKCIRSWDSYWGGGNNFYLYEHPNGQIKWIPWDMNETFQDIKFLHNTDILNGYLIPTNRFDNRPLLKRIFEIDAYKTEYLNFVCEFIQTQYNLESLGKFILQRHQLIDSAYQLDSYRYNTYTDFKKSLTEHHTDEVSITKSAWVLRIRYPGLFPFIQSQREWAQTQLKGWEVDCSIGPMEIYSLEIYPNPTRSIVNIKSSSEIFDYAKFEIYDQCGKLILETTYSYLDSNPFSLITADMHPGLYLLIKRSSTGRIGRAKLCIQ